MRYFVRCLSLVLLLCSLNCPSFADETPVTSPTTQSLYQLTHILDYIAADYVNSVQNHHIISKEEYAEMQEFVQQAAGLMSGFPTSLEKQFQALQQAILHQENPPVITQLARDLSRDIIAHYDLPTTPQSLPDLSKGQALFVEHCAGCHGITGDGQGPAAKVLDPTPTNFHQQSHMKQLSVFALYNSISHGVSGTAMQSFAPLLSDNDRWALAFYVSTVGSTAAEKAQGKAVWDHTPLNISLDELTSKTEEELVKAYGPQTHSLIAYLRTHPEVLQHPGEKQWQLLYAALAKTLSIYQSGDFKSAYQQSLAAYLDGFEPLEPMITSLYPAEKTAIEGEMLAFRESIQQHRPIAAVKSQYDALLAHVKQIQQRLDEEQISPFGLFMSALIILLREGLEIILVVGMLISMLMKAGRRESLKFVHAGWVLAIVAGAATWAISQTLLQISGAQREVTEGVTALIAAGVLLYVGLWIHRNAVARQWHQYIQEKLNRSLSRSSLFGVMGLCFIAVYREIFEIILFYEALFAQAMNQSHTPIFAGVCGAFALLAIAIYVITRVGLRLPLKQFFAVTSVLIFALAFMFIGQGIHNLEEAGAVSTYSIHFPTVSLIGIYPNMLSIVLQTILLVGVGLYFARHRYIRMRHVADTNS